MPDAPGGEVYANTLHYDNRLQCQGVAKDYPGRAHLMEMTTHEAAALLPDESFDFVFIDADHSYEGVLEDIVDWKPKVREGGWILGHDFAPGFPGVEQAVTEAFGSHIGLVGSPIDPEGLDVYLLPGRMWACRR